MFLRWEHPPVTGYTAWGTDAASLARLASAPRELNQQGCSKREQHFQQVVKREKGRVNAL